MEVALIGPYPPPYGGISVHIKRLSLALQRRGVEVDVHAQADCRPNDPTVHATRRDPKWYLSQLRQRDGAILHYHTGGAGAGGLALFAALAVAGRPVVVTLHSFRDEPATHTLRWQTLVPLALRRFSHVICVGTEVQEQVLRYGVKLHNTSVMPSYLPPVLNDADRQDALCGMDKFLGEHHPLLTASAFRIESFKGEDLYGLDMCVELCRALAPHYPGLGFVFVLPEIGDLAYYEKTRQRISECGLEDRFRFSHAVAEYWPIIERSSVMIRPTNTDSYGVSVAEAIGLGVPAVASDVCDRAPGTILFRSRDLEDLTQKTHMLLDNLDEHKRYLASCRVSQTDTVDEIMAVYRSVMKAEGRAWH